MGKDGFLTPKAIANRSKSKGLQKLRWFCQMCQKQCRDANGFKCHKLTEGHQRMMKLFLENESTMLDKFSKDFESAMMSLIRRRWRSKRVYANKVYNEYISDKTHLHMNSTCWQTLGAFIKHLGKAGLCTIDRTEKGWYLKYIDRDPEILARQAMIEQKEKMEANDDADQHSRIEKMEIFAKEIGIDSTVSTATELKQTGEKMEFKFKPTAFSQSTAKTGKLFEPAPKAPEKTEKEITFFGDNNNNNSIFIEKKEINIFPIIDEVPNNNNDDNYKDNKDKNNSTPSFLSFQPITSMAISQPVTKRPAPYLPPPSTKKPKTEPTVTEKKKMAFFDDEEDITKDYWIIPGLVVKILNKNIADGQFYGKKGVITKVIDLYVAQVKLPENGIVIKIDQAHLETVIPALDSTVAIVNGKYRGKNGILKDVDFDNYKTKVLVDGKLISKEYEEICKI